MTKRKPSLIQLGKNLKILNYAFCSLRFNLAKTKCSIGVLYLKTIVGNIFKNKLTIATGKAIVKEQILGKVNIAKNPIGYESL